MNRLSAIIQRPVVTFALGLLVAVSVGLAAQGLGHFGRSAPEPESEQGLFSAQGLSREELSQLIRDEVRGAVRQAPIRSARSGPRDAGSDVGNGSRAHPSSEEADYEGSAEVAEELTTAVHDAQAAGRWTRADGERLQSAGSALSKQQKLTILRELAIAYNRGELELEEGAFVPGFSGPGAPQRP